MLSEISDGANWKPLSNTHSTVKSTSLMRYLLTLLRQPTVNLVLDPFAGSGSTVVAAIELGMPIVAIERDPEYFEIMRRRAQYAQPVTAQMALL